jgi:putative MFS transporter
MENKRNNFPFYQWMPKPLGILILMFLFVPPTFSGGAYLSNLNEMSGELGLMVEEIQLASFFTSIGMCLFVPFMVRFLQARSVRRTYLCCFGLLIPLNYICAVTTYVPVLLAACLLIGFVRIIVMLNCTFTIAPYLTGVNTLSMFTMTEIPTPDVQYKMERMRTFLMPVLYCFILLIAQSSNVVTAWFAYEYSWNDAYYVTIAMLLVAMLLALFTMPDIRNNEKYHIEWNKVPELICMTIALCCMAYILAFGKTLDWFNSRHIIITAAIMLLSIGLFILSSLHNGDNAYLPLGVFRYRNIWMSMTLFLIAMIFNSANIFVGSFSKISTSINNYHSASLSGWAIVGCVAGLVLSVLLVLKKVRFRTTFIIAFLFMALSNCLLYFQYQTTGLFENMIWPTALNFIGLLMLYSLVAAFGMKSLPSRYLATFVFLMIWMRNSIAPVISASIYSNWLNERQQYHISVLSEEIIASNPLIAQTHAKNMIIAKASGKGSFESEQFSSLAIKGKVTIQATIVAMKEITGNTVIIILIATGLTFILPYHKKETT